MLCSKCGAPLAPGASFCSNCGASFSAPSPAPQPAPAATPQSPVYNAVPTVPVYASTDNVPPENRPLSPWAYWGYSLLFIIPIIGTIFLIVYSVDKSNINRCNYARSFWIPIVIMLVLTLLGFILSLIFGFTMTGALGGLANELGSM
jgi:uncharacterized membrane protein